MAIIVINIVYCRGNPSGLPRHGHFVQFLGTLMKIITLQNVNALIKFTMTLFVILPLVGCYESYMEKEGQNAVNSFLEEMSPELARKIAHIEQEITLTEEKINQLSKLKLKHPNYAGKIETSRRQWIVLQDKLKLSLKEIRDVVESSYVTYELDKIQGGNQFNKISDELLSSADSVLAAASTTKNAIEQALTEVENQPVPSLDDVNKPSSDMQHKPIAPHTSEMPEKFETVKETPTIEMTAIEKPAFKTLKPTNQPLSPPKLSCDAKRSLATVRLNLMMMLMSTNQTEQESLKVKIDKASINLEKALAMLKNENQNEGSQLMTLQNIWATFKNSYETEIMPAIRAGNNAKASEIAAIQVEQMKTMNGILLQAIDEDNCD
jgi:hypothetical protein